jgi:glutathione synthetase
MMESAQARGHSLFVYTTDKLALESGRAFARGRDVSVKREKGDHAKVGPWRRAELSEFDVVLLRQDPPFDMHYIDMTFVLEAVHPKTLVVNDPVEVRNAPEKLFVTKFPQLQPPTLITLDKEAKESTSFTVRLVFLEPVHEAGGRVFDVLLQGREVLKGFDVAREAGGPLRSVVKEFKGVEAAKELRLEFTGDAVLSGGEVIAETAR